MSKSLSQTAFFFHVHNTIAKMHLMYTLDDNGNRVYTLKVRRLSYCICRTSIDLPCRKLQTKARSPSPRTQVRSAQNLYSFAKAPFLTIACLARFSPDDKFSRHRVTIKKRFGVLPTQLPSKPL